MAAATLAALLHDLTCLRQALEREDFGAAGEMLAGYELHLRQFIETFSPTAPQLVLRGLLQLQNILQLDHGQAPGGSA